MAVQSDTSRIQYAGNNSTSTSYAVPFVFLENSHLQAIARTSAGVETAVALTNHTGAGDVNGGTVQTAVAVPATSTLTIFRVVPTTQTTQYQEGGDFPAASHERALDKLTQIAQQLDRRLNTCVRGSEAVQLAELPSPSGSQQYVLATTSSQPPSWQPQSAIAIGPVISTGSTTARFISDRFADIVNVRDFGAVGDGAANDSTAIQAALDYALTKTTCAVYVPAGTYLLNARLTGALISDQRLRIYGDGMYASLLLVNNVNGGIGLTGQRNAEFEMDNIWLAPNLDGAGTAFEHIVPSGGSQIARICQLTNVSMVPQVTNVALSWNRGIVIQGLFRPRLDNVIVGQGASSIKMTDICNLDQCYKPEIRSSYFNCLANVGISLVAPVGVNIEGFYMDSTTVSGPDIGLLKSNGGSEPELTVCNSHFNCVTTGLDVKGTKLLYITDNIIYGKDPASAAFTDILLRGGIGTGMTGGIISGNMFGLTLKTDRRHIALVTDAGCGIRNLTVRDCIFESMSLLPPVHISGSVSDVRLELPSVWVTLPWLPWQPSTSYVATAGTGSTGNVRVGPYRYRCAVTHTSSASFATDLAAGYWTELPMSGYLGTKLYQIDGSLSEINVNVGNDVVSVSQARTASPIVRIVRDKGVGTAWATSVAYAAGAVVNVDGAIYHCATAHTSGATFAGDAAFWLAETQWGQLMFQGPDIAGATQNYMWIQLSPKDIRTADILWVTGTTYAVGNVVYSGPSRYQCLVAHTAGTFATDLSAGKWTLLGPRVSGVTGEYEFWVRNNGTNQNTLQLGSNLRFRETIVVDDSHHLGLRSYTVSTLPVATTAARLIYVSNGTTNKRLAVSDGTNWRWPDGNIVS